MFPHNTNYDNLGPEALLKKTQDLFQDVSSEYHKFNPLNLKYKERINTLLSDLSPEKIPNLLALLKEHDFIWCCNYSYEFSALSLMESIISLEEQFNLPYSILSMQSLTDVENIYVKSIFFFRRMEFDFTLEEQLEILDLIDTYKLSPIYLYLVLTNGKLDQREKIANQLSNIYTCLEQPKWSALFQTVH